MDEINEIEDNSMINISFNQDGSCFSLGTQLGFKIYQSYPFKGPYEKIMKGGIGKVEMLYKSNFLALLGGGKAPQFNNNKVVIWDEYENKIISELKFITPVLNIKLKKELLFIICQKRIYIFNFNSYDIIETLDTGDNKSALIAINSAPNFTIIAYPSIKDVGNISIKNFKTKKNSCFSAHEDHISFMTMNREGTLLATANEKKTIVRIHSCFDGNFIKEFKRGYDKVDYIYICFDDDSKFMAVSSNKGTIHIFTMSSTIKKLKEIEKNQKMNGKLINDIQNKKEDKNEVNIQKDENIIEDKKENIVKEDKDKELLPENKKSFFGQAETDFAKFKIKPVKNICTFAPNNMLIVVSYDNKYYLAKIDIKKGGMCKKLEEKNLDDNYIFK